MIDPQTLLGAAVALFAGATALAVLYWPQPSVTRELTLDLLLRHADREAEFRGLWPGRRAVVRRVAERLALDVHEGRATLGDALHRVSCEAAMRW